MLGCAAVSPCISVITGDLWAVEVVLFEGRLLLDSAIWEEGSKRSVLVNAHIAPCLNMLAVLIHDGRQLFLRGSP